MILNQQRKVRIQREPLAEFLRSVQKKLGVEDAAVTVCFVADAEIAEMNERFRKKKGPTDVLSFPTEVRRREKSKAAPKEKDAERQESHLGDIAIAPETARRYAKENGRSLDSELRVLILHGVLHLLGYDHETDRGEMDRLERKLRRTFELA